MAIFAFQLQAVAIGWQVYDIARKTMSVENSAFLLGMIGLAQFAPIFLLSLWGGQAADRFSRKVIIGSFLFAQIILSAILITSTNMNDKIALICIFGFAIGFGIVRSFMPPALNALGPNLVPPDELPQAIAWNSLAFQAASIIGPSLAGFLYAKGAANTYIFCLIMQIIATILVIITKVPKQDYSKVKQDAMLMIKEGIFYVWNNKIVLGAIALDLAVVLFAGATALLPAFARDILHEGPEALGILRSAPAIGAVLVALFLAAKPITRHVGFFMIGATIVFGLATIGFGLSRNLWLSGILLAIAGAGDMVSVYVRQSLIQMATPDHMRGRVGAVSTLFISASNELGEFESGLAARFIGPIMAVVLGGIGAVFISFSWFKLFPPLVKADNFQDALPEE